jgi:lipoprotein NlpI
MSGYNCYQNGYAGLNQEQYIPFDQQQHSDYHLIGYVTLRQDSNNPCQPQQNLQQNSYLEPGEFIESEESEEMLNNLVRQSLLAQQQAFARLQQNLVPE